MINKMQTTEDCPFKSPEELGLTQAECDALIKALLLMENGQMLHVKSREQELVEGKYPFNMCEWHSIDYDCGTVCCIGGTAELVGNLSPLSLANTATQNQQLHKLFYQWGGGSPSPTKAARVLRGYLTTGITKW